MTVGLNGPLAVEVVDLEQARKLDRNDKTYPVLLGLNVVVYALAYYNVMLGGRLDGNRGDNTNFLAPAGYAFIIWAVIFIYLMLTVAWMALQCPCFGCVTDERIQLLKEVSPFFCAGQFCMIAWCFAYTERFYSVALLWISALCLSGIAISLSFAHRAIVKSNGLQELIFLYPGITMQFGWCTAASLLNFNTWLTLITTNAWVKLAVLVLCIVAAGVIGYLVGAYRDSLLYTGTICWALVAIGLKTLGGPEPMVEGIGEGLTTVMGVVEISVGAGIVAAVLYGKFKRFQEGPKMVEES